MYQKQWIDYAIAQARFKARQLVRRLPSLGEVADVQQDLLLDVLRRLPKFDSRRGSFKTFISHVIDNKIAGLLRTWRRRQRRADRAPLSVDDWVRDGSGGWVRREGLVDACRLRAHLGVYGGRENELLELACDLEAVLSSLSTPQRQLCVQLGSQRPSELRRSQVGGRSRLYRQRAELQKAFRQAGLERVR